MEKQPYEIVYDVICRLGGARLDRIYPECSMSRSTASRVIRELATDYMIRCHKNVWYPTSAIAQKVGQAAKSGKVGQDRSTGFLKSKGLLGKGETCQCQASLPAGFSESGDQHTIVAPPCAGPAGSQGVVAQSPDLPMVMNRIVEDLVAHRTRHNKVEGIRLVRAKISRKKKRHMRLYDAEITHDMRILARQLWGSVVHGSWDTDPNWRAWLTGGMDRLVPGWREKVDRAVIEMGEDAA